MVGVHMGPAYIWGRRIYGVGVRNFAVNLERAVKDRRFITLRRARTVRFMAVRGITRGPCTVTAGHCRVRP